MDKEPRRHNDLVTIPLGPEAKDYVMPRARNREEIERRQGRAAGILRAEFEQRGIRITRQILSRLEDPGDVHAFAAEAAPAAINSSRYRYAIGSGLMRRRLHLPTLDLGDPLHRPSSAELKDRAVDGLGRADIGAGKLIKALETSSPYVERRRFELGRDIGNSALTIACISLGDKFEQVPFGVSDHTAQEMAHRRSQAAHRAARERGAEYGSHPTLAQLADPDSDFAVHLRRTANDAVYEALEEATEEHRLAA